MREEKRKEKGGGESGERRQWREEGGEGREEKGREGKIELVVFIYMYTAQWS